MATNTSLILGFLLSFGKAIFLLEFLRFYENVAHIKEYGNCDDE